MTLPPGPAGGTPRRPTCRTPALRSAYVKKPRSSGIESERLLRKAAAGRDSISFERVAVIPALHPPN